jgi:NADH-quinone oxidoreductase subunit A
LLKSYLPVLVFLGLGLIVGTAFVMLNHVLGPSRPGRVKSEPYECGLPSEVSRTFRFGISFYLVAMLFILFDIEVVFLYPWAVYFGGGEPGEVFGSRAALRQFLFVEMLVFLIILFAGWYWVVKKRALNWEEA